MNKRNKVAHSRTLSCQKLERLSNTSSPSLILLKNLYIIPVGLDKSLKGHSKYKEKIKHMATLFMGKRQFVKKKKKAVC